MSEKLRTNDAKGLGPAIKAALEMEAYERGWPGRGKTVMLDDYFNHEIRKNKLRTRRGLALQVGRDGRRRFLRLGTASSRARSADSSSCRPLRPRQISRTRMFTSSSIRTPKKRRRIRIIVEPQHVKAIADWVKGGGVLVLMGNDGQNAELDKFNTLARQFGIQFNKDRKFEVLNNDYKMGGVEITAGNRDLQDGEEDLCQRGLDACPVGKARSRS